MIQVIDIANLLVAIVALIFSVVALRISSKIQNKSITSSFILEKLSEVHSIAQECLGARNYAEAADQLYARLKPYRLVMRSSGLADAYQNVQDSAHRVQELGTKAIELRRAGDDEEEIGKKLRVDINEAGEVISKSLYQITSQIELTFAAAIANPLGANAGLKS
jgi:hypothetical protein